MKVGRTNGWLLLAHPQFEDQYAQWLGRAKKIAKSHPEDFGRIDDVKRLVALERLVFELIPANPADSRYLLGNTLGPDNRHWRRAKFGSQYRLFFRFDSKNKIIIYAWVNNSDTLRAYGSKTDAYLVFAKKLAAGDPPGSWDELLDQSV